MKLIKLLLIAIITFNFLTMCDIKVGPPPVKEEPKQQIIPMVKKEVKPQLPMIMKVDGFKMTVNKAAKEMIKQGKAEVRLHIGYCWYSPESISDDTITFNPEWYPQGRISAGIWSNGKYISSILIRGE